ncbi:carbohydrate ABC transporter permease [Streptacidiphilus sp. EB103A]|jgi:multiple sugar transport system permease protein|uniref:carbohydrate ABC transporter permease n=1 Tax=Streptacidiphilus sp. EB103A TaxID=3156275 RepID=UPI003511E1FE
MTVVDRPAAPRAAASANGAPRRSRKRTARRAGTAFVLPYAAFLLVFGIVPLVYGVYESFVVTSPFGGDSMGLDNWTNVVSDYRLAPAMEHIVVYLVVFLPLLLLTVVSLALLVHARRGRFGAVMRFVYYLPGAVTGSASVLMWIFMISPTYGPFRGVLTAIGVHADSDIIGSGWLPLLLTAMAVEAGAGGWIVILYGALQSIPDEVLEAARIDGANGWQQALHIKLPMVRKYLAFIVITSFAGGSQLFVEPQLLYTVSNAAMPKTWSPNQLSYAYATDELSFGRASVLSLLLMAMGLAAALYVIYRTKFYQAD